MTFLLLALVPYISFAIAIFVVSLLIYFLKKIVWQNYRSARLIVFVILLFFIATGILYNRFFSLMVNDDAFRAGLFSWFPQNVVISAVCILIFYFFAWLIFYRSPRISFFRTSLFLGWLIITIVFCLWLVTLNTNVYMCTKIYDVDACGYHFALIKNDTKLCELIRSSDQRGLCFDVIADRTDNEGLCERAEVYKIGCYQKFALKKNDEKLCALIDDILYRAICYENLAIKTINPELCEKIIIEGMPAEIRVTEMKKNTCHSRIREIRGQGR